MSLPTEILDSILGYLESDTDTLKTCSRSHPTLSQLVERHLYTSVTIADSTIAEFMEVIHNRPHIAKYVRALEIGFDISPNGRNAILCELSLVLPKLSMLRRIGLISITGWKFTWPNMLETFRLAILDCFRLPYMTDIRIADITFPLSTLSHCKHINYLSLQGWKDDHEPSMTQGDNTCLPTIDSLALHKCDPDSLSAIISWIQSCSLSSLEFSETLFGRSFDLLPQILMGCSHSLTSLDVDIGEKYGSLYDFNQSTVAHSAEGIPIQLSVLPNLRHLTIRAQLEYFYAEQYSFIERDFISPIFEITEILKHASSLNRLTLAFHFYITVRDYNDEARHNIKNVLCRPLHALLSQSASTIDSIVLQVNSVQDDDFISPDVVISIFSDHRDLKQFVENSKLILTTSP